MNRYIFSLMLLVFTIGCSTQASGGYKEISPQQLKEAMNKEDLFLVDVHIPEQKRIVGTDLFIPFNQIKQNLSKFPQDKSKPVYLYCLSGPMAKSAAMELLEAGYAQIYNLRGGTIAWKGAGNQLK